VDEEHTKRQETKKELTLSEELNTSLGKEIMALTLKTVMYQLILYTINILQGHS